MMEALRYTAATVKLELEKIPIPKITKPNEVLIKVAYSGVCGTDLKFIQNKLEVNRERTTTLGHEFCGIVIDVGSAVNNFKRGDKVAVDPNDGCNCCTFCHSGNPHYCPSGGARNTIGVFKDGGWAEYAVAPVQQVHKIPESITLEQAVLTEPLSCLAHGWDIASPISIGKNILVMGAGIIGNLWVSILHLQGHKRVTVSEPNANRLKILKKLDTGYTLLTPDELRINHSNNPDYLFDVIIDCSGFAPAVEYAIQLLQKGGKLCCFGVAPMDAEIRIKPFDIYMKELSILGVNVNPYSFPKSLGFIEAMGDRYLSYGNLGIVTFALKDHATAIDQLKKGLISKAVFKFDK